MTIKVSNIKLTSEEIIKFKEQGYLILRNVLDESEIAKYIKAGDLVMQSESLVNRQCSDDRTWDSFRNVIDRSDEFYSLIDHQNVLPVVLQLLGENIQLMTSHLIYRKPDNQSSTPLTNRVPAWHRDYDAPTNDLGHECVPRMSLKCAFYLTNSSTENSGVTMVTPGSNLDCLDPGQFIDCDPVNAFQPKVNAGDCIIFENRTLHAGAPHFGDHERKVIMMGYGYRWLKPLDYTKQNQNILESMNKIQRFLVGEDVEVDEKFQPAGAPSILRILCDQLSIPYNNTPYAQSNNGVRNKHYS